MVKRGKQSACECGVELLPGTRHRGPPPTGVNRRIAAIGRQENVPVIAWYDALEDPRRPGRMRLRWTIDLAPPSIQGYRRLGESVELPGP